MNMPWLRHLAADSAPWPYLEAPPCGLATRTEGILQGATFPPAPRATILSASRPGTTGRVRLPTSLPPGQEAWGLSRRVGLAARSMRTRGMEQHGNVWEYKRSAAGIARLFHGPDGCCCTGGNTWNPITGPTLIDAHLSRPILGAPHPIAEPAAGRASLAWNGFDRIGAVSRINERKRTAVEMCEAFHLLRLAQGVGNLIERDEDRHLEKAHHYCG